MLTKLLWDAYLWPGIARGMAGHPEALPQMDCQPSWFQLNYWRYTHQAVEWDFHKAEVGKTWWLITDQPAFGRAEQTLTIFINPPPQPVESTITAPGVIYNKATQRQRQ